MLKYLAIACLLGIVTAQQGANGNKTVEVCKRDDGQDGECVSYYLCSEDNNIITDGTGILDIRVANGPCKSYLDTCCLVPDIREPNNAITPSPEVQPKREGCGQWNKDGVGFKITGDKNGESKFGEFPWMVAILKNGLIERTLPLGNNYYSDSWKLKAYVGGGSLIHPSVVLTAAHYVATGKDYKVRAGEWDTQTTKEIYPHQERDVVDVIKHKDFNKDILFYDIALLFLKSPMDMAPNVGVACLPPPRERTPDGTRCFASGWGKDNFAEESKYQVILKKVELPVVERRKCQTLLRKTRLGRHFELHTSFMCAGGEPGKDTCTGDGGSPLVCPSQDDPGRYVQHGIVAWGIGCGETGTPGVYVDVANLRDWIDGQIYGKGLDPKVYQLS